MCSPEIAKVVAERIKKEGKPKVSRRNFLKLGGLTAAGLAVAHSISPVRRAYAQDMAEVVDLSHIFSVEVPVYVLGVTPTKMDRVTVANDGFFIQDWNFSEHTGTHCDIPAHFIEDGETVDNYPANLLVSPAVVIDISAKAAEDPDALVLPEDLQAWESENGEIPPGALVCMYSGWESRWPDTEQFRNADADGVMHFPGFSGDAATWLVEERDIHGIAVDTLSLDNGPSATFDVHYTICGAGKYGIENVANLAQLMGKQATVVLGVPRWESGSGGPCRVLAMVSG
jgi:kynurenine formamidase